MPREQIWRVVGPDPHWPIWLFCVPADPTDPKTQGRTLILPLKTALDPKKFEVLT